MKRKQRHLPAVSVTVQLISGFVFACKKFPHDAALIFTIKHCREMSFMILQQYSLPYEPRRDKTGLRGFRPGPS